MDQLKNKVLESINKLKEQVNQIGENTKEKSIELVENWVQTIPILESEGLELKSFTAGLSISPSAQFELIGKSDDYTLKHIDSLLQKYKGKTILSAIFNTMRLSRRLYDKLERPILEPLVLRINARISPEIQVQFGLPIEFELPASQSS